MARLASPAKTRAASAPPSSEPASHGPRDFSMVPKPLLDLYNSISIASKPRVFLDALSTAITMSRQAGDSVKLDSFPTQMLDLFDAKLTAVDRKVPLKKLGNEPWSLRPCRFVLEFGSEMASSRTFVEKLVTLSDHEPNFSKALQCLKTASDNRRSGRIKVNGTSKSNRWVPADVEAVMPVNLPATPISHPKHRGKRSRQDVTAADCLSDVLEEPELDVPSSPPSPEQGRKAVATSNSYNPSDFIAGTHSGAHVPVNAWSNKRRRLSSIGVNDKPSSPEGDASCSIEEDQDEASIKSNPSVPNASTLRELAHDDAPFDDSHSADIEIDGSEHSFELSQAEGDIEREDDFTTVEKLEQASAIAQPMQDTSPVNKDANCVAETLVSQGTNCTVHSVLAQSSGDTGNRLCPPPAATSKPKLDNPFNSLSQSNLAGGGLGSVEASRHTRSPITVSQTRDKVEELKDQHFDCIPWSSEQITEAIARLAESRWINDIALETVLSALNPDSSRYLVVATAFVDFENLDQLRGKKLRGLQPSHKFVITPIHTNRNHWCISIASIETGRIEFYDPMGKSDSRIQHFALAFQEVDPIRNLEIHWALSLRKCNLLQQNDSDCGVYCCLFAICRMYDVPIPGAITSLSWRLAMSTAVACHYNLENDHVTRQLAMRDEDSPRTLQDIINEATAKGSGLPGSVHDVFEQCRLKLSERLNYRQVWKKNKLQELLAEGVNVAADNILKAPDLTESSFKCRIDLLQRVVRSYDAISDGLQKKIAGLRAAALHALNRDRANLRAKEREYEENFGRLQDDDGSHNTHVADVQ